MSAAIMCRNGCAAFRLEKKIGEGWPTVLGSFNGHKVNSPCVLNDTLYSTVNSLHNFILKWDGEASTWSWSSFASEAIENLTSIGDYLFATTYNNAYYHTLYRSDGIGNFVAACYLGDPQVRKIVGYKGSIYMSTHYHGMLKWDGAIGGTYIQYGAAGEYNMNAILFVCNDELYAARSLLYANTYYLYKWLGGDSWEQCSTVTTQNRDFFTFDNEIYSQVYDGTYLHLEKLLSGDNWVRVTESIDIGVSFARTIFNGFIYVVSNSGDLYKWNGIDDLVLISPAPDSSADIRGIVAFKDNLYGFNGYNTGDWSLKLYDYGEKLITKRVFDVSYLTISEGKRIQGAFWREQRIGYQQWGYFWYEFWPDSPVPSSAFPYQTIFSSQLYVSTAPIYASGGLGWYHCQLWVNAGVHVIVYNLSSDRTIWVQAYEYTNGGAVSAQVNGDSPMKQNHDIRRSPTDEIRYAKNTTAEQDAGIRIIPRRVNL